MQPSDMLRQRYNLVLSPEWSDWFDHAVGRVQPVGTLAKVLRAEELVGEAPQVIWAGFMLPDTLPLVGNAYGDWICVRIEADGRLGELIYWYHGGGDWIPVGSRLAEALLHDAVDIFRPNYHQPLRGADEFRVESKPMDPSVMLQTEWADWLTDQLSATGTPGAAVRDVLKTIVEALACGDHRQAVWLLWQRGWARHAAACDLIEHALRYPVRKIVLPTVAEACGVSWYPHFVQLMFDTAQVPPEMRALIAVEAGVGLQDWPQQDWDEAARLAEQVLSERDDLGWATTVAGWARQRRGALAEAANIYWQGRFASSFSDQSVRLGCHAAAEMLAKFAIVQLGQLTKYLSAEQVEDPYLRIYLKPRSRSLLYEVSAWWMEQAEAHRAASNWEQAYKCYYRAGWDLGVSRLDDYVPIFEGLADSAERAGWPARAEVARTHLRRLQGQRRR